VVAKKSAEQPEVTALKVRRARPGTGLGLFTTVPIKKGAFVVEYTGKQITNKQADEIGQNRYIFEISKLWSIDGSPRTNLARYVNHACKPNCEADIVDGRLCYYAKRNIKVGEELTIDYGIDYFEDFIKPTGCKCVSCEKK
jgi:hypothetical protein